MSQEIHKLMSTLESIQNLPKILVEYEKTGDHKHGHGPIPPGHLCAGGDCLVYQTRRIIIRLDLFAEYHRLLHG